MSKFFSKFHERFVEGPGGLAELMPIAIPMFFSSMFDMLMMFIDRLFLSRVGVVHQAAAMSGGTASWMVTSFFVGIVGYSSALIAQYHGAGQKHNCVRMVNQALLLSAVFYPLILLTDYIVMLTPVFSGHSPEESVLEIRYFWYMAGGSILALLRFTFGSFFSGIGKTKAIMLGNFAALFVNIFANWVLIFGHLGFPALGLDGAAIGTILSALSATLILAITYFRTKRKAAWHDNNPHGFDREKMLKLLRYGLPQGGENVLGMIGFVFLVSAFHSYGNDVAAATTVCFNWDSCSFHPVLGIQVGVTTLVGRYMGQENPKLALRAAHSGFFAAIFYTGCMLLLFLAFTHQLVNVFTPDTAGLDYTGVRQYAIPMLRLCGLYLMTDAIMIISGGVLRGAGDTFWSMIIHLTNSLIMSGIVVFCVRKLEMPPLQVWLYFVIMGMLSSSTLFTRYLMGRWQKLRIIADSKA